MSNTQSLTRRDYRWIESSVRWKLTESIWRDIYRPRTKSGTCIFFLVAIDQTFAKWPQLDAKLGNRVHFQQPLLGKTLHYRKSYSSLPQFAHILVSHKDRREILRPKIKLCTTCQILKSFINFLFFFIL